MKSGVSAGTMTYVLCCILFTIAGLVAAVVLSASQVRGSARFALLSLLRGAAACFGYIIVSFIYIPLVLLDKAADAIPCGKLRDAPTRSPTLRRRKRNNSDVSDLDLGEAQYTLQNLERDSSNNNSFSPV
ncbi:hypothetical protein BX600DRAFT_40728 [Xylariales sp. PMI_506]|nr:hypothetical protein BX600DRAFT_40728 [Xylariales sp. PMI_506]